MIGVFHFTATKRLVKQSIWLYFQPSMEELHVFKKSGAKKKKTVHWGVKGQPFLYDGDTNTTVAHIYKIFFRDQWFVCTPPIAFALSTKDVSYSLGCFTPSWIHLRYVSRFFVQGIFPQHLQLALAWAMSRFLASTSVTAGTLSHDAWDGFYRGSWPTEKRVGGFKGVGVPID